MSIALPLILILTPLFSLFLGLFFLFRPALIIEIQRKFYAKINWKIEPISLEKEIRNTRIMGFSLAVLAVAAIICIFLKGALV